MAVAVSGVLPNFFEWGWGLCLGACEASIGGCGLDAGVEAGVEHLEGGEAFRGAGGGPSGRWRTRVVRHGWGMLGSIVIGE